MTSGGKRKGAGRPAIAPEQRKVTLSARVSNKARERAFNRAKASGISVGDWLDNLILNCRCEPGQHPDTTPNA